MLVNVTIQPVNLKMKTGYDFIRKGTTLVSNKIIMTDRNIHYLREVAACATYIVHEKFVILWVWLS